MHCCHCRPQASTSGASIGSSPDLNDFVRVGSTVARLAKPLMPQYHLWFEPESPNRVLRFEGPYGPPGAPELIMELDE